MCGASKIVLPLMLMTSLMLFVVYRVDCRVEKGGISKVNVAEVVMWSGKGIM